MKKNFAFGAFLLALALIAVSVAILRKQNPSNAQSRAEQSQTVNEEEHMPEGMPWEIVSRHFISLY